MRSYTLRLSALAVTWCCLGSCTSNPDTSTSETPSPSVSLPPPGVSAPVLTKAESDLSKWSLREKIGQLLIIGYRDDEQIADIQPGGVAMFSWSMKTVEQTRELTDKIRDVASKKLKAPLMIATDHEGGRVIRLRNGMTLFPEASAVGFTNDTDLSRRVGHAVGEELAYLGINANFAPVLDLGGAESFLGNRIWGQNPEEVAQMTGAYIQGMQDVGVFSVAKHFPGHGPSAEDAHFSVPVNHKKLSLLWGQDLHPFKQAVIEKVPAMMTAHVRVPEVDRLPASMSSRFLSRILRDSFKFEGVIITDDLEMKGAQESLLSSGDLALQALIAGSDMLMIVWSKADQKKVIARIERAIKDGEWSEAALDAKLTRILKMKSDWVGNTKWTETHAKAQSPLRSASHLQLVDEINSKPVKWVGEQSEKVRDTLSTRATEKWRVALPKGAYAAFWQSQRPQDEVFVHERRINSESLKVLRDKFSAAACASVVCLMLTESATQSSPGLFTYIRNIIEVVPGGNRRPASQNGAFVWAHMGLEPPLDSTQDNTALVVLGASGVSRLRQLASDLKARAKPAPVAKNSP